MIITENEIRELIKKYPNDSDLGRIVRAGFHLFLKNNGYIGLFQLIKTFKENDKVLICMYDRSIIEGIISQNDTDGKQIEFKDLPIIVGYEQITNIKLI